MLDFAVNAVGYGSGRLKSGANCELDGQEKATGKRCHNMAVAGNEKMSPHGDLPEYTLSAASLVSKHAAEAGMWLQEQGTRFMHGGCDLGPCIRGQCRPR